MNYRIEPTMLLLVSSVYGSGTYNQNVYSPASTTQTNNGQTSSSGSTTSTTTSGTQSAPRSSTTSSPSTTTSTSDQPSPGNATGGSDPVGPPSTSNQTLQPSSSAPKSLSPYMPYIIGGTLLAVVVCIVLIVRILLRKRHNVAHIPM